MSYDKIIHSLNLAGRCSISENIKNQVLHNWKYYPGTSSTSRTSVGFISVAWYCQLYTKKWYQMFHHYIFLISQRYLQYTRRNKLHQWKTHFENWLESSSQFGNIKLRLENQMIWIKSDGESSSLLPISWLYDLQLEVEWPKIKRTISKIYCYCTWFLF